MVFRQKNKMSGYHEHLIWDWRDPNRMVPKLFKTRREAREWAKEKYGYISKRPDLRAEPHGWMPPKVTKVLITVDTAI